MQLVNQSGCKPVPKWQWGASLALPVFLPLLLTLLLPLLLPLLLTLLLLLLRLLPLLPPMLFHVGGPIWMATSHREQ